MIYNLNGDCVTHKNFWLLMKRISKEYLKECGGTFEFDFSEPIGEGESKGDDATDIWVGMKGVDIESNEPMIELSFMKGLVAIYHEWEHALQGKFSELYDRSFYISYIAFKGNPHYCQDNYFIAPFEIDAERYGVLQSHYYCVETFGKIKADEMLIEYVNDRIDKHISFIKPVGFFKKYYDNAHDIFDDFDKMYDKSYSVPRKYKFKDFYDGDKLNLDPLYWYGEAYKHIKRFFSSMTGEEQDEIAYTAFKEDYKPKVKSNKLFDIWFKKRKVEKKEIDLSSETDTSILLQHVLGQGLIIDRNPDYNKLRTENIVLNEEEMIIKPIGVNVGHTEYLRLDYPDDRDEIYKNVVERLANDTLYCSSGELPQLILDDVEKRKKELEREKEEKFHERISSVEDLEFDGIDMEEIEDSDNWDGNPDDDDFHY